jgi:hypothetical protein
MRDPSSDFRTAILATLGHAPETIEPGRFQRFGTSDRRGDSAGWCKLFDDLRGGVFGCYRQGINETWSAADRRTMTTDQRATLARQVLTAKREREAEQRRQWTDNAQRIAQVRAQCQPLTPGDPVTLYLKRRGLGGVWPLPAALRLHRALPCWHEGEKLGTFPAMVAPLASPDGVTVALHRTYLTADGRKAEVPTVKKLTGAAGPLAGACIPLHQSAKGCIGIAEGIETALAAWCASAVPTVARLLRGQPRGVAVAARRAAAGDLRGQRQGRARGRRHLAIARAGVAAALRRADTFGSRRRLAGRVGRARYGGDRRERRMSAVPDDVDRLRAAGTAPVFDRAEALKRARVLLSPSLNDRKAPTYPVGALGPLAPACEAIAEGGQVQPAMVGQCLLGAASLLTQGLFNVQTLTGKAPLSLYLLTLGDSGDGKSTAQRPALASVTEWQCKQAKRHAEDLKAFEKAKGARRKPGDDAPEMPASPFRLVADCTVEGLRRDLDTGPCSQGVYTDEAAAILSGYGMSADHRSKTAGVFSKLWDDGHLSVSRATGARVERYGRRVALHWLIQPMAAAESIGDPLLSALGFWPRFLAAWPAPQAPRLARGFLAGEMPAVRTYWQRCDELLAIALPDDAGDCLAIPLADDARELLGRAFERFEQAGRRGALQVVKPFALRSSEQACRVAGVLSAFEGRDVVTIEAMRGALALVSYSLETWKAIIDEGAADQGGASALRLYEWLTSRADWRESLAVIVNGGPACVRSKDKRDAALALLQDAALVEVIEGRALALMPDAQGVPS